MRFCGEIHDFDSTLKDVLGCGFYSSFKNNPRFKFLDYMHKCQA